MGDIRVSDTDAIAMLTLAWGDHYEIYKVGDQWQAWYEDAPDLEVLTGNTPAELNIAIRLDYLKRQPAP